MKAFVTGGTGFIGGHLVRKLRDRGDEVVAMVRDKEKASALRNRGVQVEQGDLASEDVIRRCAEGADAVFHAAAMYKVGVPKSEREAMIDANVRGTERVLDAAIAAGVPRVVYVSTVNVFGNTNGQIVDERYRRPDGKFLSSYDETKYRAHELAEDRAAKGAPVVIVQPGGVYGPGDHSEIGNIIDQTRTGKLKLKMFPETGFNLVYVEDVADGILLAHELGEVGESYVLGGEITTMGDLVDRVAAIAERRAPKRSLPSAVIKLSAPAGPLLGKAMGFPPNFKELISASDGVTYWAKDDKARQRLGYRPRDLDTGLRQTLAATKPAED
jgi:nucleoside-diphosphate-sugar epimerase